MSAVVAKKMSNQEKNELINNLIGKKYDISGKDFAVLSKVIDYIGNVDSAITIAELLPKLGTLLAGSRFFSVLGSGASILSVFLFPIDGLIKVTNAWKTGSRLYSYRAIAYSITAWAFNRPMPKASMKVLNNVKANRHTEPGKTIPEYNLAWKKAAESAYNMLTFETLKSGMNEDEMKLVMRALGDGDERKLCALLLSGFEQKLESIEKLTWKANYSILYPN